MISFVLDTFQRIIDIFIQGILGVVAYIDDVLMLGKTKENHDRSLYRVLQHE